MEYLLADGRSEFALAMCRSRVAPRNPQTLPRLERLAALIAVRLGRFLSDRLDINFSSVRYYTDSKIAYHWATSSRPGTWKQLISSRVAEIQTHSSPSEWYHVKGRSNESYVASRGISAAALISSQDWWFGPAWLRSPPERRPITQLIAEGSSFEQVSDEA